MEKNVFIITVLLLFHIQTWGQSDTLSFESISLYYQRQNNMIEFYQLSGNTDQASKLTNERDLYIEALKDNYGKGIFYLFISDNYYNNGNYQKAIEEGKKSVEILKNVLGIDHHDYALSLANLATNYSKLGNYTEAIKLNTEALEICKKEFGTEHPNYAILLNNLATDYSELGNYTEAIKLETEALGIRKKAFSTEHPNYASSLVSLACFYSKQGEYSEAIRLGAQAKEILKKAFGTEHPDYALSLSNLATDYFNLGNYTEAIKLETEALEIRKKAFGTKHPIYAVSLANLACFYAEHGNYSEAILLGTEAMEIRKDVLGTEHPDYAISLINLARAYSDLGNHFEAIRLETKAMEIRKDVLGTEHPQYALSLHNLASDYSVLGHYSEAIRLNSEVLEILKKVFGTGHPNYAVALSERALYYAKLGNYYEAIRIGIEAMRIQKEMLGTEHPNYTISLNNLANYYSNLGNYSEAIRLCTGAMEIRKKVLGTEHPSYSNSLFSLSCIYYDLGNYTEAIRMGMEAMEIRKKVLGIEHPDYATSLSNLAYYYSDLGNYSEAIRLGTEAMEIRKKVLGTDHQDYALSLSNLAKYFFGQGMYSRAYDLLKHSIKSYLSSIHSLFFELSSGLQATLWQNSYACFFNSVISSIVFKHKTNESLSELYNKTALFSKGILLNTNVSMRKLILESGDTTLLNKYNAFAVNSSIYRKQIKKPIKARFIDIDSLRSVIQQQAMELARESKACGDYTRNLRINWKNVQKRLGSDDIAIEFLDFPLMGTDSVMYVALTLRKDSDTPKMTVLFEEKQLKAVPDTLYYQCQEMTDIVWKPLQPELKGIKNIFFSPSGALYNIGIEYLPGMEDYNIYRLSSTRELVTNQKNDYEKRAVLYGGLDYDAQLDSLSKPKSHDLLDFAFVERANVETVKRGMKIRGAQERLEYTKEEVEQIGETLRKAEWSCLLDTAAIGTEESFKALSGKRISCLHIATHGFYYTPEEADNRQYKFMLLDNQHISDEDKALTRSGLLLTGANHILEGDTIPDDVEDGILTAKEIADVDLRGLDLVVLSACQTGLGDIAQGEGVFGLQRGFKKAGANSILMSLWEVEDKASQILMTQFYKNLLSGQGKHQALLSSQKYLREYEGGKYDEPKYWAAFIILDAID